MPDEEYLPCRSNLLEQCQFVLVCCNAEKPKEVLQNVKYLSREHGACVFFVAYSEKHTHDTDIDALNNAKSQVCNFAAHLHLVGKAMECWKIA